jgi:hypothetical protein
VCVCVCVCLCMAPEEKAEEASLSGSDCSVSSTLSPWWAERAKARSIMARRERVSASAGGSGFRVQVRV